MRKPVVMVAVLLIVGILAANHLPARLTTLPPETLQAAVADDNQVLSISSGCRSVELETLDDYLTNSTHVVIGKIVGKDTSKFASEKVIVAVQQQLKGSTDKKIDIYTDPHHYQDDEHYLFFLEYWDHEAFPRPVYAVVGSANVKDGKINGYLKPVEGKSVRDVETAINASPKKSVSISPDRNVKDRLGSIEGLINDAEYIAVVTPSLTLYDTGIIKDVLLDIKKEYRGQLDPKNNYILPASIQTGQEYLVFLKQRGEQIVPVSRFDSIISSADKANWSAAMRLLER